MAIKLIETTCTVCGSPMRLPEHILELPHDERLCAECVRALARAGEVEGGVDGKKL